jgi:hypothetical protein
MRLSVFLENHKNDVLQQLEKRTSWPHIRRWQAKYLNSEWFYVNAYCAAIAFFGLAMVLVMVLRGDIVSEKSEKIVGPNDSTRIDQGFSGDPQVVETRYSGAATCSVPAENNANKLRSMPAHEKNKRRLIGHGIATLHVRRTKLVSALHAYLETTDRPYWRLASEIGTGRPALRNWKNGKAKPQFDYLDRIKAFLRRQKYAGRSRAEILNAFRRFYRETSLSDYTIARMIGVDPAPIPSWIKGTHRPQLANLRKIDRFMEKYGPEYLRP